MFRYLVAHLQTFRLDRCGYDPRQLVALLAEQQSALRVQSATPAALRRGVRTGMSAAQAQALVPDLLTEILDADGEQRDLSELAEQLLRISPAVAPLPPDALVAEIGRRDTPLPAAFGGRRRAGGERALLERVRIRLEQLGHRVTVVIADDPATALACAAYGRRCQVVPVGGGARALAPLPLHALELPEREHALLDGLGIRTVGDFSALPPAAVVGRLGPVGVAAHGLASGRGHSPRIASWQDDGPLVLGQDLPDPVVELDALLFVINALLRDAAARLTAAGRAVARLLLHFELDTEITSDDADDKAVAAARALGGSQQLSVRLGDPTRDARRILSLLRLRLERFQLAAPVTGLVLELPDPVPFDGRQGDLQGRHKTGEALAEVAGRLQDTLGADAVFVPRLASRHRPEAEWVPSPAQPALLAAGALGAGHAAAGQAALPLPASTPFIADVLAAARSDHTDPVREWEGFPSPRPPNRPPILLHPPQAIDVQTGADLGPSSIAVDGRWLPVVGRSGPESLAGEWWQHGFRRSYWRVLLCDGRRAWIYKEDGRWVLQGWWDR